MKRFDEILKDVKDLDYACPKCGDGRVPRRLLSQNDEGQECIAWVCNCGYRQESYTRGYKDDSYSLNDLTESEIERLRVALTKRCGATVDKWIDGLRGTSFRSTDNIHLSYVLNYGGNALLQIFGRTWKGNLADYKETSMVSTVKEGE